MTAERSRQRKRVPLQRYTHTETLGIDKTDTFLSFLSFGIILWEIITLHEPFEQFNDFPSFKKAITVDDVRYDRIRKMMT